MKGVPIPPEQARDPQGRRIGRNREPARTPMQWETGPKAGFTTGEPWLPIGEDRQIASVAPQREDARSLLSLYRRLIAVRSSEPALLGGELEVVSRRNSLLVFRRKVERHELLIALNMSSEPQSYGLDTGQGRILLSTELDRHDERVSGEMKLRGGEGLLVETR